MNYIILKIKTFQNFKNCQFWSMRICIERNLEQFFILKHQYNQEIKLLQSVKKLFSYNRFRFVLISSGLVQNLIFCITEK